MQSYQKSVEYRESSASLNEATTPPFTSSLINPQDINPTTGKGLS